MKILFKAGSTLVSVVVVAAFFMACGTKGDEPGECKMNCGNAMIAPNDYTIKNLSKNASYRCSEDEVGKSVNGIAVFSILKKVKIDNTNVKEIPVPYISIRPFVNGSVDTSVGSGSSLGLITPSSDFCSDSCGTVSLQFKAICPKSEDSSVSVNIKSGALASETPFELTLLSPTKDDSADAKAKKKDEEE